MLRTTGIAMACVLLAACGTTTERPQSVKQSAPVSMDSLVEYVAYQRRLRADLEAGETRNLTPQQARSIMKHQDIVFAELDGVERLDELDEDKRLTVFNAQQSINGILANNVENTPICRREATLGSHRQRVVCMTPEQRRVASREAQRALEMFRRGKGGAQAPTGG